MGRKGLKIAVQVGLKRRKFTDLAAAEKYYDTLKEEIFSLVDELQKAYPSEVLDYSPESLKAIEKIYFDYCDHGKFSESQLSKDEFEILLAIYEGQVYVLDSEIGSPSFLSFTPKIKARTMTKTN